MHYVPKVSYNASHITHHYSQIIIREFRSFKSKAIRNSKHESVRHICWTFFITWRNFKMDLNIKRTKFFFFFFFFFLHYTLQIRQASLLRGLPYHLCALGVRVFSGCISQTFITYRIQISALIEFVTFHFFSKQTNFKSLRISSFLGRPRSAGKNLFSADVILLCYFFDITNTSLSYLTSNLL